MSQNHSELRLIPDFDGMEVLQARLSTHRFPVHFHETFVIELIQSGADWCCANDMLARQGEVFVHFPYAPHSGGPPPKEQLSYQAIYPSIELFSDVTGISEDRIPTGVSFVSKSGSLSAQVQRLFIELASHDRQVGDARLKAALCNVFQLIVARHFPNQNNHSGNDNLRVRQTIETKLSRARDYLIEQSRLDVSNRELSRHCDLSEFHLIRSFKRQYGITPRQFLISHRILLAKQKMNLGMPLAEAALATGFADQSHLTRCFKRVTSCSPGQYVNAAHLP